MFSFISMNWRGKPLTTYRTIVESSNRPIVATTTTKTELKIAADIDTGYYPTGVTDTDAELAAIPIQRHEWRGDWNYSIKPTHHRRSTNFTTGPKAKVRGKAHR